MSDSASLGSAKGSIELDVSSFSKGIAAAQKQLTGFGQATAGIGRGISSSSAPLDDFASKADRASQALGRVSQSAAIFGGAIAVGVGAAVKSFASFEQQVNALGAVSGASASQLTQLSDLALQIGKDTAFGATEAATALTELAKAGVPLETILAGTGRAAVDLAAATGTDLASSANILANVMNVFADSGIAAADAIDILTAAANASSADIGDLAAGLRVLGPVAANLGVDMADTAAAIAYFTNFGLKAADAGVSLARAIDRAAAPTDEAAQLMQELGIAVFDANHEFVGFEALFANLQQAMGGLSDEARTLAIATIFGAEAQDVINIAVSKGAAGYAELRASVEPAGQAAEGAAARMKGLSGALDQARGSVETMAIAFGSALAPAIEFAAGLVESMADAFTALPGPIQATAAASIAAAGGLALVAAAVAKTISFALDSAVAFKKMSDAIHKSAIAMRLLSAAFSPASLLIGLIAFATFRAIKAHRDHQQAIKDLDAAYKNLGRTLDQLKLSGQSDVAADLAVAATAVDQAAAASNAYVVSLQEQADALEQLANSRDPQEAAENQDAFNALNAKIQEQTGSTEQLAAAQGALQEAFSDSRVDTDALRIFVESLSKSYEEGTISAADYFRILADLPNNLAQFAKETDGAVDATADLADATNESAAAAEKAAKAYEEFLATVDQIAKSTVDTIKGFEDASSELDGMQTAYKRVGESMEDMLLRMDRLNKIDLSDAEEEALHLSNHLLKAKKNIERVTDSISENQDNMALWSGRISLVTDTLGGNTETLDEWLGMLERGEVTQGEFNAAVDDGTAIGAFEKLDALLASGAISQSKYNEAKEAGVYLLKRSSGALADEREELVEDTIALAAYVKEHDNANGAVNGLSEAQRGFLAALNSSSGALFLQTLQLLLYLEAVGRIPSEKVTEFLVDSSAADPVVAALIDDLGLLEGEKKAKIIVTGDGTEIIDETKDDLDKLPPTTDVEVAVTFKGDGTDLSGFVGDGTDFPGIEVPTSLAAPDTSAVTDAEPPKVEVPAAFEAPDDTAVTGYKPATITIPTKLGPPDATELTDYKPPTITVPMEFGTPTGVQAAGEPAAAVTIPTTLGAPDTTALDTYTAPTEIVPTKLGVPDASILGEVSAPTETIPTALGAPTTAALDDLILDPVIVPTIYGTPSFAEGTIIQGIDPVTIDVDTTAFDTAMTAANVDLTTFGARVDTSELAADREPFTTDLNWAIDNATNFDNDTFETSLDAEAGGFYNQLLGAIDAGDTFANRTFTATADVNIQPALDALAELARNLPSSPAEKGPLSKVPSFGYVVDSFVSSMIAMEASARRSLSDVSAQLDNLSSLQAVKSSFSSDPLSWMLRDSLLSPVTGRDRGTTVIDHSRTEVKWIALTESDLRRLAAEAARGGEAHGWIIDRERAMSTAG